MRLEFDPESLLQTHTHKYILLPYMKFESNNLNALFVLGNDIVINYTHSIALRTFAHDT